MSMILGVWTWSEVYGVARKLDRLDDGLPTLLYLKKYFVRRKL